MRLRTAPTLAATVLAASLLASGHTVPPPGTATQVRALVAASHRIWRLPASLTPPLAAAAQDNTAAAYPVVKYGCASLTQCVFGSTTGTKLMVLFGDSHAEMWLSAVLPYAQRNGFRLVLLTTLGCPAAAVTVWLTGKGYYTACTAIRQSEIGLIVGAKPAVVVIAERTAHLKRSPTAFFTNPQWQTGLESTLSQLRPSGARIVVLGDNPVIDVDTPQCLAAYPTNVQHCASRNPSTRSVDQSHEPAERAAALADGARFINPVPWLCTTSCSPVVGNMVVYWDTYHVTNTYAVYLSRVVGGALASALR